MKTGTEIARHVEEIITNIYLRPAMYGQTVDEVDSTLLIYHGIWAYVTESEGLDAQATSLAIEAADSGSDSFTSTYRKSHPGASDHETLLFVLKHWAMVTEHLGIPLPPEFPDPSLSFQRNTV